MNYKQISKRMIVLLMIITIVLSNGSLINAVEEIPGTIAIQEQLLTKQMSNPNARFNIPFDSRFSEIKESNSFIKFICHIDGDKVKANGTVQIAGQEETLNMEGSAEYNKNNAVIVAALSGDINSIPCAAILNYDTENECSFITMSIGEMSQDKSIMELTFGRFTSKIESANDELIKSAFYSNASDKSKALGPVRDTDSAIHKKTGYFSISGSKMYALSTYFPTAVSGSGHFMFRNKLTTNNANILTYIQNNIESSASGPIRVYSASIVSRANTNYLGLGSAQPGNCSTTATIYIPYFWGTNLFDPTNYGIATRTITIQSITQSYTVTSGYQSKSTHNYYFGTLGSVANTDYGTQTPNETQNGLSVAHEAWYGGTGSSITMYADATVVAGYVGNGPRPGSRIVKSATLGSLSINANLTIQ